MAKGSIATAWIQVLPSLEGLQSALVKASKGAALTPAIQPKLASGTSRLFASHGLGMSRLFSGSFNKSLNLQGGVRNALDGMFASFGSGGRRSANAFGTGFANLDLDKYLNAAAAIAAVASVGKAVKGVTSDIIEMGNQWGQTTAMLKNAAGGADDYKTSLETSLEYANRVGVTTDDFIQSAARLRTLAPDVVANYGDAAKFTKLLDMNMISTGASTQEASSAMRQITQALGKGIVNGDELNSIMENSPQIARMLAQHLNASVGDLKQLGKEGKISGQALYDTVLENADAIERQFNTMPVTADRAWNSIKNTVGVRSAEAATALSANLGKALTAITGSGMTDTVGEMLAGFIPLSNAAATLAVTFAGQLGPAVNKAFNVQQVEQFLAPLTNLISLNSQNASLLSALGDMLNTVGVVGATTFSLMVAMNDRFASRIPFIGRALVDVKGQLSQLGSNFTGMFGSAVSASSAVIDKLASMADVMADTLADTARMQNALGKFNVAFEDLGTYAFSFGQKGAEGFETVQQAAANLRTGVGQASENVKLLQTGLNAMGSDSQALPETFLKAFETLNTVVDAAAKRKAPTLIQAFRDIHAAAASIIVDSHVYRSLDMAGQSADIYRDKLVQVGREFKELTGFNIPNVFLPLAGSAVSASDSVMRTFGNLKTGLANFAENTAQQWMPVKEMFANVFSNAVASVKANMEAMRADVASGIRAMVVSVSEVRTAFGAMLDETGIGDAMSKLKTMVGSGLSSLKGMLAEPFDGLAEKVFGSFKGVNPFAPLTSAAKTLNTGLSATIDGVMSRLAGRFSPLASAGKAAFGTIGSAALKASSGALKMFGMTVRGCGTAIGQLGTIASQLGVTGAIFTGLTAGFETLFKLDPAQTAGKFEEWQKSLDSTLTGIQTRLPAMADAFSMALPQMVASVTTALPGIADAFTSVGRTLAPALMTILPQITQAFSDMFSQLPALTATYGQPLLEAFGSLFATLAAQIPSLMTSLGQTLTVGIQAAFNTISENSGAVSGFISGFGASLAAGLQTLGATLVAMLPSIGASIATALPTLIPALMSAITGVITSLAAALPGIAVAIINQLPAIIGGLASGIVNSLPTLLGAFISVAAGIAANFPSIFMAVVGAVPAIIGNIARPFAGLAGRIVGYVNDIPGRIIGVFANAGSWLVNSGAALMNGFKQGILGALENVKNAVKGALQKVRDFFPFSPAKVGPFSGSGYTSVSGEHLMRDFGKAIGAQGAFVRGQVDNVLGSLDFDQVEAAGVGMVSAPRWEDYTGIMSAGSQQPVGGVHIDNVVASPLSDVELVARRFGYALNNEMIGSVRP